MPIPGSGLSPASRLSRSMLSAPLSATLLVGELLRSTVWRANGGSTTANRKGALVDHLQRKGVATDLALAVDDVQLEEEPLDQPRRLQARAPGCPRWPEFRERHQPSRAGIRHSDRPAHRPASRHSARSLAKSSGRAAVEHLVAPIGVIRTRRIGVKRGGTAQGLGQESEPTTGWPWMTASGVASTSTLISCEMLSCQGSGSSSVLSAGIRTYRRHQGPWAC